MKLTASIPYVCPIPVRSASVLVMLVLAACSPATATLPQATATMSQATATVPQATATVPQASLEPALPTLRTRPVPRGHTHVYV